MVRFLESYDEYRLSRQLAEIAERSRINGSEVERYDLSIEEDREKLLEAVRTDSLFLNRRLFLVAGIWDQAKYALELFKKTYIIEDSEREAVFWYRGAPAASADAKSLRKIIDSKKLKVESIVALSGGSLQGWIRDETAVYGISIATDAITALIDTVSPAYPKKVLPDTWRLHEELEKLCNYVSACCRSAITADDVGFLVHGADTLSVFELVDDFARGDKKSGLVTLTRALGRGDDPYYLFSMLVRQFRMLARIKGARKGMKDPAKELSIHPFAAKKAVDQARRLELGNLVTKLQQLRDIEVASKSGDTDMVSGLYAFLFSLSM